MALKWNVPKTKAQRVREYFADWYEKNRVRIAQKRAERYRTDPAYRAAILARSRQQRKHDPSS